MSLLPLSYNNIMPIKSESTLCTNTHPMLPSYPNFHEKDGLILFTHSSEYSEPKGRSFHSRECFMVNALQTDFLLSGLEAQAPLLLITGMPLWTRPRTWLDRSCMPVPQCYVASLAAVAL